MKKNYLYDELTTNEKAYLNTVIVNARKKYIRNNYDYLNNAGLNLYDHINVEDESILDAVINKCEAEIKSAVEFEKIISDDGMYSAIKALSLKEKMVLFSLYKKNKPLNQVAFEMKIDRITAWRIKNKALDKIMKSLLGGNQNV